MPFEVCAGIVHSSRHCVKSCCLQLAVNVRPPWQCCQSSCHLCWHLLSTCTVSAVVRAVMYKRLQKCRAELWGGELWSSPQLSQSLLWSRAAASLHAGGGDSVKAGPEGEGPPTREEEEEGEKMQANPAYLPIEMSYKSQESKYINVSSWSNWRIV